MLHQCNAYSESALNSISELILKFFFIKNLTYPGIISRYYIFNNNNFP